MEYFIQKMFMITCLNIDIVILQTNFLLALCEEWGGKKRRVIWPDVINK